MGDLGFFGIGEKDYSETFSVRSCFSNGQKFPPSRRLPPTPRLRRDKTARQDAVFLSVFVLPILQSGSTVSASSGGQLRKSVVRKTKHNNGGKKLWDYSIQYSVQ
jgi:hypothetical protein